MLLQLMQIKSILFIPPAVQAKKGEYISLSKTDDDNTKTQKCLW